ncbi:amino acid permease-domain-containing protein [Phlyctochytrium arcticum]|nr:amino acid permease-domain-containing protein [Phlyctochytrium arcticum]
MDGKTKYDSSPVTTTTTTPTHPQYRTRPHPFGPVHRAVMGNAFGRRIFGTKSVAMMEDEIAQVEFKRTLSGLDLMFLGIGAIIGAGIFVLTGTAARDHAGPALVISFLIAGFVCGLASMCYAELASMIPASGSAYSFTYVAMGEFLAWIVGWDLMLEYMVGAATVAVGWSSYLVQLIDDITGNHDTTNPRIVNAPFKWVEVGHEHRGQKVTSAAFVRNAVPCGPGGTEWCEPIINLPAIAIVLAVTAILVVGVKESTRVNNFFVVVKVVITLMFIFAGIKFIQPANYSPFIPPNEGPKKYGVEGVFAGAVTVFFAYIGFDAVSTTAQEAKNPQKDLPVGIIGSLSVCTILYIAVSAVMVGLRPFHDIESKAPVASNILWAAANQGVNLRWFTIIVSIGAVAGLTSVILTMLLGQPRIFHAMAKDGLLPKTFSRLHPRFHTPYITTITTGVICALFAGILPVDILGNLTSVGTLLAFLFVSLSTIILKITDPDRPRGFSVPGGRIGGFVIPTLAAACVIFLLTQITPASIARVFIWMALGTIVYVVYGYRHSHLRNHQRQMADKYQSSSETL